MKLGEILVSSGFVTKEELDDALKSQVIFGGRLGTNLIEMGYVDEEKLSKALSKLFSVRCIFGDAIMEIPENTLRLLPNSLVEKYKIIPLQLNNKRLSLAMLDPSNFYAIDEVSFVTGYIVEPVVCPEIRMVTAMEKLYSIHRDRRYIKIHGSSRAQSRKPQPVEPVAQQGHQSTSKPIQELTDQASDLTIELTHDIQMGQASSGEPTSPWAGILPPGGTDATPTIEPEEEYSIDRLSTMLAEAGSREDIAEAVIRFTGRKFKHVALFLVKHDIVTGWLAQSEGAIIEEFPLLTIPLDSPSVLKIVAEGKSIYIGPVPDTPCNTIMLDGLDKSRPTTSLLIPLLMMGRVVTIFYADGSKDKELADYLPDLKNIIAKAVIAFEILILKNKLLSL